MALTEYEKYALKEMISNPKLKDIVEDYASLRPEVKEFVDEIRSYDEKKNNIVFDNKTLISDYIEYSKEKFAAVITKSQYAIKIGMMSHEDMIKELIQKTRPDIELDGWGNAINPNESYTNGNIVIAGYPGYVLIELPHQELLTSLQFECLKDVLLEYKKGSEVRENQQVVVYGNGIINIEGKNYNDNILGLIEELKKYINDDINIPKEEIIGISLDDYKKIVDEKNEDRCL